MIGLPNFDLTNQSGKQKFVEYIVNLMRNEIVAFTASYNDFEDESRSSLPDGLLVNNHRIGLDVNKPIAGDVTPGTYYTSTDINLGTTYRSDGIAWTQIAGSIGTAAIPVGTIIHTGQSTIPAGFIDCDGSSQLRSLYPTLFTAIGTTFGAGASPGTTFALPLVTGTYGNFVILADAPSVVVTTQTLIGAPIATLQLFAGSVYPTGYLRADGTAISRTSYADLFAVIGTTYGVGDGSTTFNLPNLLSSGSPSPVYIMKVSLSGTVEPSTVAHASSHIRAGTDVIDGDRVQVDYVPTNYTRDSTASGAGAVTDLTAHLAGIDTDKLRVGATAGGDLTGTYPNPTITNITNAPIYNSNTTLSFRTSSTERIGVDTSGRVTLPYQPMFWAYGTGYIGRTAGDAAAIVWGSTLYNTGSHYNTGNGRFTAPVSGTYLFSANMRLDSTGAGSYLRYGIRKNGTSPEYGSANGSAHAIQGNNHSTDYSTIPLTSVIYLAANDYVWSYCFHISTTGNMLADESNFSGCFLG